MKKNFLKKLFSNKRDHVAFTPRSSGMCFNDPYIKLEDLNKLFPLIRIPGWVSINFPFNDLHLKLSLANITNKPSCKEPTETQETVLSLISHRKARVNEITMVRRSGKSTIAGYLANQFLLPILVLSPNQSMGKITQRNLQKFFGKQTHLDFLSINDRKLEFITAIKDPYAYVICDELSEKDYIKAREIFKSIHTDVIWIHTPSNLNNILEENVG